MTRFVNVSTDKAADPTSVLGLSKRVAERITAEWSQGHPGTFLSVRFGNVLGSRGSVLTTFRAQVASGGPITVTHPDVTRFFMTIEEAVTLVISAGTLDEDGHALILDMGEPVRIDDVARRLAASSDRPIDITYTGLRPGEKMHEVLIAPHEVGNETGHPLITAVPVEPLDPAPAGRGRGPGGREGHHPDARPAGRRAPAPARAHPSVARPRVDAGGRHHRLSTAGPVPADRPDRQRRRQLVADLPQQRHLGGVLLGLLGVARAPRRPSCCRPSRSGTARSR